MSMVDIEVSAIESPAFVVTDELRDATDRTIDDAVVHADPMILRGLLYQLTADQEAADVAVHRDGENPLAAPAPARDSDISMLRGKAGDYLKAVRDGGGATVQIGATDTIPTSMRLTSGVDIPEDGIPLWQEELALDPSARGLTWTIQPTAEQLAAFPMVVIGAGMAGLNAALQLKRAGLPFTVLEKNAGPGGTWYENRYPGCRLDTPSRAYTHTVGVDFPYPYAYAPAAETKKYTDWFASHFGLEQHISFETEVVSLTWDESSSTWTVITEGPHGRRELRARGVMSAVGFLNRPNIPSIKGQDDFAGPAWHTARWPESADLTGKRVAVIGTGCTGYQLIPELAQQVEHLVVFQRTPQWLFEVDGYLTPLRPEATWLQRNFPFYTNYLRFRELHVFEDMAGLTVIDPAFDDPHTRSESNRRIRELCISFLERKLGDPELVRKMTPAHPPRSARAVLVDTQHSVLDALVRDDVTLVSEGIARLTPGGIEAHDGGEYEVDAIVYATGFRATEYLFPMKVTGRDGETVEELWRDGGARSHRFSMIPGFPNFWMLYGPNTNGGLQPAAFDELVTHYALKCIEKLVLGGHASVEPRVDAYLRFSREVDEANAARMWSDPRAHNYYWTEHGRSSVMCPFLGREVYRYLREPDYSELTLR
ncbi:flavin-containing monooxygenase [Microbacterium sp. A196]|uniref:flavin-containing monooxygenase n=1 Tax=Microbacterium sp. A196 TaxID=3457320 RepID=UPI003FD198BB